MSVNSASPTARFLFYSFVLASACAAPACGGGTDATSELPPFEIEEATIGGIQGAIASGQTSCEAIVQAYVNRARAYNGVCTALVTADGAPIPQTTGYVRAGAPIVFPTETVAASTIFPDLEGYRGLPLDYGRMEPTISDPSVQQQTGMRVGIPNARQVNGLETFNIRGERSVTCKGAFDAHPSTGPLPPDAPEVCEAFRQQPDALERARELDARYGSNPDLAELPLYCVAVAFKDPYDTKDMRTTANNDVNFAMDAPPFDSPIVARLRAKGAIIYAKAVAHEFNAGPGNPGGSATARRNYVAGNQAVSSWSGQACNPYDTERVPRGSSSGSGVAVGANLVTVAICEQTSASCQGPASRNNAALLLPTKGVIADNGGIGNQSVVDRAGIIARTLTDATVVLDALKDTSTGHYEPQDVFTAIPKGFVSEAPYADHAIGDEVLVSDSKPLAGVRIAILREHMVTPTANHMAIAKQIEGEIKTVLRDRLGADLVETITPDHPDDPDVPNLTYTLADAFSETLPRFIPEVFSRRSSSGELLFAVPGYDVESYEYLHKLSLRQAPLSPEIRLDTIATVAGFDNALDFRFTIDRYLALRGDARVTDWESWVANARFRDDFSRAGAENWARTKTILSDAKAGRFAMSDIARLALMKVMYENDIDLFVHAENTVPTPKIQGPNIGTNSLEGITPLLQIPRIAIPAGYNQIVYEPQYALNSARTDYVSVLDPATKESLLPHPMPISITFFAGQGDEPILIKVGTAYEAATHHRKPPPDFGPVHGDRQE